MLYDAPETVAGLRHVVLQLAVRGAFGHCLVPDAGEPGRSGEQGVSSPEFALPGGWQWLRLKDAGEFLGGGTPSKSDPTLWQGDVPWVSPKDMKRLRIEDSADHIAADAVERSAVRLIPAGAVLMVVRGMILARAFPVALTACAVTVDQDMKALVLHEPRYAEWILLALRAWESRVLTQVERSTHGTCRLESAVLRELSVPLPPHAEQLRVLAKVDDLLALCDQLDAHLADARTRSALLASSVMHHLAAA